MLKRLLPFAITAALVALVIGTIVEAQPIGPSGIQRCATNTPGLLAGSCTTSSPLTATIHTGGIISGTGSDGAPITATEVGDISSVVAGTGLSGGASSGAATLTVNIAGASCAASEAITALGATGTGTCSTVGDITSVVAGTGLSGGATSGAATLTVNVAGASCSASEAVTAIGATGTGTCSTVGDITSVVAGSGLSGGATSGAATLTVDTSTTQARVTGTCTSPNAVRAVAADGSVTCTTGVVSSSSLTTNTVPKATGANALGDSRITDDATTITAPGTVSLGTATTGTTTALGPVVLNQTLAVTGATTLTGATSVGSFAYGHVVDSTTSGTNNNYALSATVTWLEFSNATSTVLSGITGGVDGRELYITSTGVNGGLTITNEGAASTAANRIKTSQGVTWILNGGGGNNFETFHLIYDGGASRWRQVINSNFAGSLAVVGSLTTGGASIGGAFQANAGQAWAGVTANTTTGTQDSTTGSPLSAPAASVLRWTGTSNVTFDGFASGTQGKSFWIMNASTTSNVTVTIATEAAGSTASMRIIGPNGQNVILPGGTANQNSAAFLWYDITTTRWRVLGGYHFGTGTANTMTKWTAANTLGDSSVTDDGTTWAINTNKVSVVEASGNTTIAGTLGVTGDVTVTTTKNKGTIALSTGTGTATVLSGSICACSDSTANASVQCSVTTTTLTATGTGSDVITYLCF